MPDKERVCAYKYCLHGKEKVKESEAVVIKNKYYHWDCATTKQEIEELRNTYFERIDRDASFPILSKILNDLVFKYDLEIDYIRYALNYYAEYKVKVKSPFTLLYLRNNDFMKKRWKYSKGGDA